MINGRRRKDPTLRPVLLIRRSLVRAQAEEPAFLLWYLAFSPTITVGLFAFWPLFERARMTAHPTPHRLTFSEVAIGQRFDDPVSAEYFVKQSDSLAAMVTGIGDGTVPDEFEADDVVGIDQ